MLLVVITVVVGILLYSFVFGFVENQTKPVTATAQPFSVLIDNVVFNKTCITVYVRNSLDQDITVERAYVNNEPHAVFSAAGTSATVPKSSVGIILIPGTYNAGCRYEIKLAFVSSNTIFTMAVY